MKTLAEIAEDFNISRENYKGEVIAVQQKILLDCADGKKGLEFIEDNMPPYYYGVSPSEVAPHWRPSLSRLAGWIANRVDLGKVQLPLIKDAPLKNRVYVLDKNGILDVGLYISDTGINCKYEEYRILDSISPFIGTGSSKQILNRLGPFYAFAHTQQKSRKH